MLSLVGYFCSLTQTASGSAIFDEKLIFITINRDRFIDQNSAYEGRETRSLKSEIGHSLFRRSEKVSSYQ